MRRPAELWPAGNSVVESECEWLREDEQVGSREPFGGGFEVVDPRLSQQAPGGVVASLFEIHQREVDSCQREVAFRGGAPEVGREEDGGVAEQEQVVLRGDPIDGVVLVGLSG